VARSTRDPEADDTSAGASLPSAIARLRRTLRVLIRSDFPWEALPMAQVELLMSLQDNGSARVGQLADDLRLAQSTVSGLVQQLVEAGLAERSPDAQDRRASSVSLTAAGSDLLATWRLVHEERIATALDRLPAADRQAITAAVPALFRLNDELAMPGRMAGTTPTE
jgi:DNA-binding MarR family transcriptional regulator